VKRLNIMDHTGHSTIDVADEAARREAQATFDRLVGEQKYVAGTRKSGATDYRLIRSLGEADDEVLLHPQNFGG
jgi:hypothetical protein